MLWYKNIKVIIIFPIRYKKEGIKANLCLLIITSHLKHFYFRVLLFGDRLKEAMRKEILQLQTKSIPRQSCQAANRETTGGETRKSMFAASQRGCCQAQCSSISLRERKTQRRYVLAKTSSPAKHPFSGQGSICP